ncbi:MAG TPA: hypothetical protein VLA24_13310, partial [Pseudomonadales bacterium]|nr:hypothetical protein [Pseudomonadales bacterium]
LALLNRACQANRLKDMDISQNAKVLVINTEGATAPGLFNQVTGTTVDDIIAAQANWLAHN